MKGGRKRPTVKTSISNKGDCGKLRLFYFIPRLSSICGQVSGFLSLALVIVIFAETVARTVFNIGIVWSFEISEMLLVLICFFALADTLKERRHVRIEVIDRRLAEDRRLWVGIAESVLALPVMGFITWKGFMFAHYAWKIGLVCETMPNIPLFPFRLILPIGFGLLFLQIAFQILDDLRYWLRKRRGGQ